MLGSNFTTGNAFPIPTNCVTGKHINFEGTSGPLAACFCQVCSASTPELICTRAQHREDVERADVPAAPCGVAEPVAPLA